MLEILGEKTKRHILRGVNVLAIIESEIIMRVKWDLKDWGR